MQGRLRIAIVGYGTAGQAAALFLSAQGHRLSIFEQAPVLGPVGAGFLLQPTGLGVLDGDSLLTVAQADGPNLIAVGDWTGRTTPLHCVASGKVLLAALAEREVLRIVRRGLVSHTERTITELEPLLEELARIRRRGYATAIGEYELGLNAVSAPVHDARGNVVAAVDIWGPAFRLTPRRIPELAVQAREAAAAISVRLGGPGPAQGKSVSNGVAAPVTPLPTGVAAAS